MKIILISLFVLMFSIVYAYADRVIIVPREQQYFYSPSPYYDYYNPYQPYNGPMRGPNSIEGHKSQREQLRNLRYR